MTHVWSDPLNALIIPHTTLFSLYDDVDDACFFLMNIFVVVCHSHYRCVAVYAVLLIFFRHLIALSNFHLHHLITKRYDWFSLIILKNRSFHEIVAICMYFSLDKKGGSNISITPFHCAWMFNLKIFWSDEWIEHVEDIRIKAHEIEIKSNLQFEFACIRRLLSTAVCIMRKSMTQYASAALYMYVCATLCMTSR